jgi:hypothetical protein
MIPGDGPSPAGGFTPSGRLPTLGAFQNLNP